MGAELVNAKWTCPGYWVNIFPPQHMSVCDTGGNTSQQSKCLCGLLIIPYFSSLRAKEIKIKLGILLQKPDSADLVIPYNEKPEKPAKAQR